MRIMTFNTQHCLNYTEQKIDFAVMGEAIKQCGADIVGLNEMRDKGVWDDYENQTEILSRLTGLKNHYFAKAIDVGGESNPYGNGLLSKYAITNVETIAIPDPEPKSGADGYESRCIIKATLENSLTVLVTHFGLNADEQKNAADTVLKNMPSERCILMGDFNVCPNDEILNPIRKSMTDAADFFEKPLLSFPSDSPDRKIDYIFVTPDIEIIGADIPAIVASDHRPHIADIKF